MHIRKVWGSKCDGDNGGKLMPLQSAIDRVDKRLNSALLYVILPRLQALTTLILTLFYEWQKSL